jgi:radical SAM superfamily enzyme YgiQ (UPF0313 family)
MRVGVVDLLATPARSWSEAAYHLVMTKQYASIMPQAVAVWCRQLGHETAYATYYGLGDPRARLPRDLDVLFIASYSQASALAYALAKLYRSDGTLTVLGGPHARAFPRDSLRFFDLVVGDCDRALVAAILAGAYDRGQYVSAEQPLADVPRVEERLPEIHASAFAFGRRPFAATTVPLLASTGCPYACDFCTDWDRAYRVLPLDGLREDLAYLARRWPGIMVAFHDPNFAVKFDLVLDAIESVPPSRRSPYIMEISLAILRGDRAQRLGATRCASVAPGVESWTDYAPKSGVGRTAGSEKVARVIEQFRALHEHVPYLQANFMLGLDSDEGEEPVALTKEFMTRAPFVWPVVNIPHPFGGTPLQARYLREGRILPLPFSFYYSPYLVTTLRHYDPLTYYRMLIELFAHFTSPAMLRRRLATARTPFVRLVHRVRTYVKRERLGAFRRLLAALTEDAQLRAFHAGQSPCALPEFYHREYERTLGSYATLLSRAERMPELDPLSG